MLRCAHCGHYGSRNAHCLPRKRKPRHRAPRPRQRADKNDRKRGILPTECSIPVGTPRYCYKPFEDRCSIRLLILLPGNKWQPIRCELVVQSLDSALYEAISYVWGPNEERGDILCHGHRVRVPWNLEHALRKFRRLRKKRVLWADSVCINQDDMAERSQQVQLMARVYEEAKRVLVWLGHSSESCLSDSYQDYSNPSALFHFIKALGPLPPPDHQSAEYVDSQIKSFDGKHWSTFRNLNHTGWFNRLWIIQEIGLASNAIVHLGPASVHWNVLASFCLYMRRFLLEVVLTHKLFAVANINELQRTDFRNSGQSIPSVLYSGSLKRCSDPHDKIYGFLGHKALRDTISNPQSELFLPVDYSTSYKDLYTAVAARTLQAANYSSIRIIDFVAHDSISIHDNEIASWVPRWESSRMAPPVIVLSGCGHMSHGQTTVKASLNGNCLSVAGFTFDSVVWVSDTFRARATSFPIDPSSALDDLYPHPFVQAWNHIRMTGKTESRSMLEAMCLSLADELVGDAEEQRRFVNGAVAYAYSMGLDVSGIEDLVVFEDIPFFRQEMIISKRVCLITSRGWVGMSSGATLPGDDVCIFFGAPTPFVARQLPSAGESLYRLCGPCPIQGIMQGEAIKMFEKGAFEKTIFNLI